MRVITLQDAVKFVDKVGFAYVFPDGRIPFPSLWGAVSDDPMQEMDADDHGWTKETQLTWRLKDELGGSRKVWFGRFFRGTGYKQQQNHQ